MKHLFLHNNMRLEINTRKKKEKTHKKDKPMEAK